MAEQLHNLLSAAVEQYSSDSSKWIHLRDGVYRTGSIGNIEWIPRDPIESNHYVTFLQDVLAELSSSAAAQEFLERDMPRVRMYFERSHLTIIVNITIANLLKVNAIANSYATILQTAMRSNALNMRSYNVILNYDQLFVDRRDLRNFLQLEI